MTLPDMTTVLLVLSDLLDPDPCDWDHNHSCQAHGHFYIPQGQLCPVEHGKQLVQQALASGELPDLERNLS